MSSSENLIGIIVPMMKSTTRFSTLSDAECEAYAAPFCDAGQVVIGRTEQGGDMSDPFGFAFWAKVDQPSDEKLRNGDTDMRAVGLDGLSSGDHPWLVEVACKPEAAKVFLQTCAASVFPGTDVNARLLSENGTAKIVKLTAKGTAT